MNAALLAPLKDAASLQPDLSRALRATIAFMVPVLLAATGWISFDMSFVAIAAQNIAMVDVRGDYRLRLALLVAMTVVFAGAAALGATVAHNFTVAVLATGLMAVFGGVWRHLSSDYGPSLAISSTLVFFIGLSARHGVANPGTLALAAGCGGLWGVLIQVANWPFRPQHAVRRTVADSCLAVANLFDALVPVAAEEEARRLERVAEGEAALRTALDQTYTTLEVSRPSPLHTRLETLNLATARLATRVVALNTAIESVDVDATLGSALEPALTALANLERNIAIAVVSRQPAHLIACEVRFREMASILGVLRTRVSRGPVHAQIAEIVRQIEQMLPSLHDAVRATVERANERAASSLELPDLRTLSLRPLASALNLSWNIDPSLVRYTLRLAALTMLGVLAFKLHGTPHGYWLPFTVVVVLQPDYGSTRQRAGQRVVGTLVGSVLASLLLWVEPSWSVLMAVTAMAMFAFGYFLKRNYALAVFFITLFIVFVTEANEPVTVAFTIERLASTLAGGALALAAAFVFWPVWERDRLPPILAQTFRANRDYLGLLVTRLKTGGAFDREVIDAKRRAEAANSAAFSSLRRLNGDPKNQQEGLEHAATLVNGNQRLTRVLSGLALHVTPGRPIREQVLSGFSSPAAEALQRLGDAMEHGHPGPGQLSSLRTALANDLFTGPPVNDDERWIHTQLGRATTELSTLLLTLESAAPPWSDRPDQPPG